jgi:hypothetical protein
MNDDPEEAKRNGNCVNLSYFRSFTNREVLESIFYNIVFITVCVPDRTKEHDKENEKGITERQLMSLKLIIKSTVDLYRGINEFKKWYQPRINNIKMRMVIC